jgi:D-sedoheptulose 7-phosphate isomerase
MNTIQNIINEHKQILKASIKNIEKSFLRAHNLCLSSLQNDKKLLICGNGGSAADAQHFAAELVGRFEKERKGLPAVALTTDSSIITAIANDYGFEECFARQVQALGQSGDVLIVISTTGNSPNIIKASQAAKQIGIKIIGLTGEGGGTLRSIADELFTVPSNRKARIQEIHEIYLHALAETIEVSLIQNTEQPDEPDDTNV